MNTDFEIFQNIKSCYDRVVSEPYHRYRSWEHCYFFFQDLLIDKKNIDFGALHLAFYLASWGMYRGSSNLLQNDYKIHIKVIEILLKKKYQELKNTDVFNNESVNISASLNFELLKEIGSYYKEYEVSDTNTLITKVVLGTYASIPAYDSFLYEGMKYWNNNARKQNEGRVIQSFGRNSYISIIDFLNSHKDEFVQCQNYIAQYGIQYPFMKLIDMYFWNIGNQLSSK